MRKQFPEQTKCDDQLLKEAGGSETLLRALWNKFPSLRHEFQNFQDLQAYGKALADGRSAPKRGPCVRESDPQRRFQLAN